MEEQDIRVNRRVRYSAIVIISQMLLFALALAWGVYLILIARNGGVLSVENNPWVLYGEIVATFLIIQFALIVIGMELYRMKVRRHDELIDRDTFDIEKKKRRVAENKGLV